MKKAKRIRIMSLLCVLALVFSIVVVPEPVSATGLTTFNQKPYALKKYNTKKFKVVKNKNYGKKNASPYVVYDIGATTPHYLTKAKGNCSASAKTWMYLPKSYQGSGDMGNPQSISVIPNGKYAYVAYPKSKNSTQGRIIRYNLQKLAELGITVSGNMDDLRGTVNQVYKGKELTDRQKEIFACMKVGPWITFGHGAAMAYNPKDKHLWFTTKTGSKKTDLQRINMTTLKPDLRYNYTMYSNVPMGNNLTFDKYGRIYFFTYSGKTKYCPKGTIKIYQGTINTRAKKKKVTFKLTMSGIKYAASTGIQSAGYNPKTNRLYLVSNSALVSVPVSKLGKLKPADVRTVHFKQNREFEGLSFDSKGNGYLLVNKQPEIMMLKGI